MGLFDFLNPEAAAIRQQGQRAQLRSWLMILYDPSMRLTDRVTAYESISKIEPVNYPETPRITLIYSLTKGKLAKASREMAVTKRTRVQEQLQQDTKAGYRQALEGVLYDPSEDLIVREQAYRELSKTYSDEFPILGSVSLRKSISVGDIAVTSRVLHPRYISPQEQKKLDIQKAKEEKVLAKEQEKKLAGRLKGIQSQLSVLKTIQEKIGATDTALQSGLLDLAEKRIELETKIRDVSRKKITPEYSREVKQRDTEYLDRHLAILTQREEIFNSRREMAAKRLPEIAAARSYAEAQGRYLRGEPEPDINDDYTIYTWNEDGTLAGITTEGRPSIDQKKAREAGEFAHVGQTTYSQQRIFNKETGALTTLPPVRGEGGGGVLTVHGGIDEVRTVGFTDPFTTDIETGIRTLPKAEPRDPFVRPKSEE